MALGLAETGGGELRERPINKTTMIPIMENPPRRMGSTIPRSRVGWLSIRKESYFASRSIPQVDLLMIQAVSSDRRIPQSCIIHMPLAAYYACLIPKPTSFFQSSGAFTISSGTKILLQKANPEVKSIADLLATYLQEVSGDKALVSDDNADQGTGNIRAHIEWRSGFG